MKNRVTSFEQSLALRTLGVKQNIENGDWFYNSNNELCFKCSANRYIYEVHNSGRFVEESCDERAALGTKAFDGGQIDELLPTLIEAKFLRKMAGASGKVGYYFQKMSGDSIFKTLIGWGKTHLEAKTKLLIKLLETDSIVIEN